MFERLDEKAAGAAGRVEDHFAKSGIHHFNDKADDCARRVELAGVSGSVAHLLEHRLVKMAERVNLFATGEMNVADFVDHVAQQITVDHPVDRAFEHRGDNIAPVTAVGALQAAKIGEQAGAFLAVRSDCFFIVHEGYPLIACDSVVFCGPVAPAVRCFQCRMEALAAHLRFLLGHLFHVVEELEEHDPGEHRQAIEIAVEPFVLAHDVATGFNDRG
jgi:hypothetical protein